MSLFVITGRRIFLDFFQYLVYINLVPKFVKGGVFMALYFCAKISQEHSEQLRSIALDLGVSPENMVFKTAGCEEPFTLGVYIKFKDVETLNKYSEKSTPFILERWL